MDNPSQVDIYVFVRFDKNSTPVMACDCTPPSGVRNLSKKLREFHAGGALAPLFYNAEL